MLRQKSSGAHNGVWPPPLPGSSDFAFAGREDGFSLLPVERLPYCKRIVFAALCCVPRGVHPKGGPAGPHMLVVFKGVSQGGKSKSPLGRIFGSFLCEQKGTSPVKKHRAFSRPPPAGAPFFLVRQKEKGGRKRRGEGGFGEKRENPRRPVDGGGVLLEGAWGGFGTNE
jgi:hypothetical protein